MVAIVGRPNVGKSTLFNKLTGSDAAIVDDRPGVTRDRLYGTAWLDTDETHGVTLVDTGGFETDDFKFQPFAENLVWKQTDAAIKQADLVLLLLDAKDGINPHDRELVRYLERLHKPYVVAINKVDGVEQGTATLEFYELGLSEEPLLIAAAHSRGFHELRERLIERLSTISDLQRRDAVQDGAVRVAIVGRPNAGKSSILNRIVGEERALVSDIPGTTRDAIDAAVGYDGRRFVLVDTAGIRRKSRIDERIESLSVIRSLRAIDRADVVLLVLDATQGLTEQDARLASHAAERMKPMAIVVNKWDLIPDKDANSARDYIAGIRSLVKTLAYVPVAFVSCTQNQRVHSLLALADRLATRTRKRVPTSAVNAALRTIVQEHSPALIKGKTRRVKFFFATQVAVAPPTIVVFCNVARELHDSYVRYMINRFRAELGFEEVPLRVAFRSKADVRERDARAARKVGVDALDDSYNLADVSDEPVVEADSVDEWSEAELAAGEDEHAPAL
jgi:GTP-binding protein